MKNLSLNNSINEITYYKILLILISASIILYPSGPFLPDLLLTLTVLIFFFILLKKNQFSFLNNRIIYFFLLFYIYIVSRSIFSIEKFISLQSTLFYFRFLIFSFSISYLFLNYKKTEKVLLNIFLIILLFVIADSYLQYFYLKDIFGFTRPDTRLSGPFNDELIVGSYISKTIPLFFAIYFYSNTKINIYYLMLILLSFLLVFISGERTSFFYMSFFVIIFFIFYKNKNKNKYFFSFLIISILLFSLFLKNQTVKDRMFKHTFCTMNIKIFQLDCKKFADEKTLQDNRVIIFSASHEGHYLSALKMFKDKFIFGVGPKMFRFHCDDIKYKNAYSCTTHPHNTLLQILSELGIIGLIFYIIVLVWLFKNFYLTVFKNKSLPYNQKFSFVLLNVCLFQFLFFLLPSGQFFNNYLSFINYLPLGLYLVYYGLVFKNE